MVGVVILQPSAVVHPCDEHRLSLVAGERRPWVKESPKGRRAGAVCPTSRAVISFVYSDGHTIAEKKNKKQRQKCHFC